MTLKCFVSESYFASVNSGIVIFFTLFPRYRSLSKPNKRLGYSVECGMGLYTKLVQGKCKHASLAALTNPQIFVSLYFPFWMGRGGTEFFSVPLLT